MSRDIGDTPAVTGHVEEQGHRPGRLRGRNVQEAARRYGVGRQWVHEPLTRYAAEGDPGLEPRSRRPRTNPQATAGPVQARMLALRTELTTKGLDAGAETIAAHLEREGLIPPPRSTIHRILHAAGTVIPEPHKRPRSSLRRFTAAQPNEMWQSDVTYWALADGTDVESLDFIDDHSCYLLHLTAQPRTTPPRPQTPHTSEAYEATPKAAPSIAAQGEHWRIRTDRVDADGKVTLRHTGRLRHLGIGRAHKHKRIILLVRDADVAAVEHGTGEILAEFTIDPARGYQLRKQNTPGP